MINKIRLVLEVDLDPAVHPDVVEQISDNLFQLPMAPIRNELIGGPGIKLTPDLFSWQVEYFVDDEWKTVENYKDGLVRCPVCEMNDCEHIPYLMWVDELTGNLKIREDQDVVIGWSGELKDESHWLVIESAPGVPAGMYKCGTVKMEEVLDQVDRLDEILEAVGYKSLVEWPAATTVST